MARNAARIGVTVAVATAWACLSSPFVSAAAQQSAGTTATAEIRDATGRTLATAELREDAGKVQVALVLPSPSPLSGKSKRHV